MNKQGVVYFLEGGLGAIPNPRIFLDPNANPYVPSGGGKFPIVPTGDPTSFPMPTPDVVETRGGALVDRDFAILTRGGGEQQNQEVDELGKPKPSFFDVLPTIADATATIIGSFTPRPRPVQQPPRGFTVIPNSGGAGNPQPNSSGMSTTTKAAIAGLFIIGVGLAINSMDKQQ